MEEYWNGRKRPFFFDKRMTMGQNKFIWGSMFGSFAMVFICFWLADPTCMYTIEVLNDIGIICDKMLLPLCRVAAFYILVCMPILYIGLVYYNLRKQPKGKRLASRFIGDIFVAVMTVVVFLLVVAVFPLCYYIIKWATDNAMEGDWFFWMTIASLVLAFAVKWPSIINRFFGGGHD